MRGNYKVRVRVPIYATAVIEHVAYGAEDEAAAIAEAQDTVSELDIGMWFQQKWIPLNRPLPSLAEVIEFEATEPDQPKEKEESTE